MGSIDNTSWSQSTSGTSTPLLKQQKPLSLFQKVSPDVSIYTPPKRSTPSSSTSPTTILFCAWMDSHPKHINYYTSTYMTLYPSARIILVRITTNQFMFQSEVVRRKQVAQAVSALLDSEPNTEKLLVHAFSNGGNKRVYNIAGAYRTRTGNPLPVTTYILDSAPGIPKFRRDIHALQFGARHHPWLTWIPYMLVIYLAVTAVYVSVNWMPKWFWHELVWAPTAAMNDMEFIDGKGLRGYVYSEADLVIWWKDVENHAREAKEKGFKVEMLKIEGAAHVQMPKGKEGPEVYWSWIKKLVDLGS